MANTILYFLHFGKMKDIFLQTPIIIFPLYLLWVRLFLCRRHTETVKKEGSKSSSNVIPILDQTLEPEELAEMNVGDLIKDNLDISGKKL